MAIVGEIIKIAGPVIVAKGMRGSLMYEVVRVGEEKLIGEIIELGGETATIQVYEETGGIAPGAPVEGTGLQLSVELGPGIMKTIYDGIQRPLVVIKEKSGTYITRGIEVPSLDREKKWDYTPMAKVGDKVKTGDFLGETPETDVIMHKVMVPPTIEEGEVTWAIDAGSYTIEEVVAKVKTDKGEEEIKMYHTWPVRAPRPFREKLAPNVPLLTGQRILDTFFPVAKGGAAAIPGPFGAGKTVTQHQLAKWCDAEIIVYVGCGERGNEMTEVLQEFPHLEDPKTGKSLMERTTLLANTSNMPVAARDASVYTGITLGEYYRDMGYNVAMMADSTSRWAEAMREISGRLEEMPGEEGYPAYLASRLATFYERAGRVMTKGSDEDRMGSLTVIGAVSPPGGDFSEPVTQNTLRITKVFWALDAALADRRHFPAINWLRSYSLYENSIEGWWNENVTDKWMEMRNKAMQLLQKEAELQEIVQLVGPDALPERERVALEGARVLREDFLQQMAFHEVDTYCSAEKQMKMLEVMLGFYDTCLEAVDKGAPAKDIADLDVKDDIARLKYVKEEEVDAAVEKIKADLGSQIKAVMEAE